MHETFDHTADLGLRARAEDLDTLFGEAARALMAALVEEPASIEPTQSVKVRLPADDLEYLLFDWLKALLAFFESDRLLFADFQVHVSAETGLVATAWGEPADPSRHELAHEVKAITYHDLRVAREDGGWVAEVIVDI